MKTKQNTFVKCLIVIFGAIFLSILPASAAETGAENDPVGKVVAVRGNVVAVTPGSETRKLMLNAAVFLQDTIKTDKGRVQLVFNDNTLMTLGQNTELKITKYFWRKDDKNSVVETDIKEGCFRIMGGKITRIAPDNFKTHTPSGTIGIRGSMYAGVVDESGLTVVFLGGKGIYVENETGLVDITKPGFGLTVENRSSEPGEPVKMTPEELSELENLLASSADEMPAGDSSQETQLSLNEMSSGTAMGDSGGLAADSGTAAADMDSVLSDLASSVDDTLSGALDTTLEAALPITDTQNAFIQILADLGFTGSASGSVPSSGIWEYKGELRHVLSGSASETLRFSINWDNHRIMTHDQSGLIVGFGLGTVNADGSITGFKTYGSSGSGGTISALSGSETYGHIFGTGQEAIGLALDGYHINIETQSSSQPWSDAAGAVVGSKSSNPYSGTAIWNGYFIGVGEDMAAPTSGRRVFRNTDASGFQLSLDKTNGVVSGTTMSGTDVFNGSNSLTASGFGGSSTDSVYISDKQMAATLDGGNVTIGGPTAGFKTHGNYMVTTDKEALSTYTSWGQWEVAYTDPSNGKDYHIHAPGAFWIAGEQTSATTIGSLIGSNFSATYTGRAEGVQFDASNQMSALTNGVTSLLIDFDSGATPSVNGTINFDQVNLLVSSLTPVTTSGFTANITNAVTGTVNGTFFGPNAEAVGGNFSAQMVGGTNYHGIFAGDR